MAQFDGYVEDYRDEVQSSISFSGQEVAFFHQRKADALVELTGRLLGIRPASACWTWAAGSAPSIASWPVVSATCAGSTPPPTPLRRGHRENPEATYAAADGARLPFADGGFDVVFAVCVLHHVVPSHRVDFALELARVVRPGGLVVVFEHNALNPLTRLAVSRCEFDEGVVLLTRGASTRVLMGADLAPIEARDLIFTPFDHRLARRLDQAMGGVPLGAQHYVVAQRPSGVGDLG